MSDTAQKQKPKTPVGGGVKPKTAAEVVTNNFNIDFNLTKREFFVGMAMLGLISGQAPNTNENQRYVNELTAAAFKYADAAIEHLEESLADS